MVILLVLYFLRFGAFMYISRFETQISRFFPTHFQTSRFGSFRGWKVCTYGGGGGGGGGGGVMGVRI